MTDVVCLLFLPDNYFRSLYRYDPHAAGKFVNFIVAISHYTQTCLLCRPYTFFGFLISYFVVVLKKGTYQLMVIPLMFG